MPNICSTTTACAENEIPTEYTTVEAERAMLELDPEKKKRVAILEANLQEALDEQARSLGELIEQTVKMHKEIKEEVAKMWEQDKEEDQLVEQSKIKTQLLEKELIRHNPNYEAYKESRQGNSSTQCEWPQTRNTVWEELFVLTPELCTDLVDIKKGVKDIQGCSALHGMITSVFDKVKSQAYSIRIYGEPVHDLSLSTAEESRDLLGLAVSLISYYRTVHQCAMDTEVTQNEIQFVNTNIRIMGSIPICSSPEELLFRLLCSPVFLKRLTASVIHGEPLPIAIVPIKSEITGTYLRVFSVKGVVRLVEERLPHVHPGTGVGAVDRKRVMEAVKKLQDFGEQPGTCVIDVVVVGGEVSVEWVHKMNCDKVQVVPWEDFCSMVQKPEQAPDWVSFPSTTTLMSEDGGEASYSGDATLSVILSEAQNLIPSKSCWATTNPHPSLHLLTLQPTLPPPSTKTTPSEATSSLSHSSITTSIGTSVSLAALAFATGYFFSNRKQ